MDALYPVAYVCVVTDFNLPNLQACLTRRPEHALLVISGRAGLDAAARRLSKVLKDRLPGTRIHMLDRNHTRCELSGDHVADAIPWIKAILTPRLDRLRDQGIRPMLNLTGGTKALAIAMAHGYDWDTIDYKPERSEAMESFRFGRDRALEIVEATPPSSQALLPLDVARLYAEHVEEAHSSELSDIGNTDAIRLAKHIWQAQSNRDPGLHALFDALTGIWSAGRGRDCWAKPIVTLSWKEFSDAKPKQLQGWMEQINTLSPDAFEWNNAKISLPGNKARGLGQELRRWLSGDWLEQLAHCWLLEAGLPCTAIIRNLKSADDPRESATSRETDLFIHYRDRTSLVEAKAGLPPLHSPAELERQVSSLGDHRFGRTRKSLLISPLLRNRLTARQGLENFELRCQANRVTLLTDKDGLSDFILPGTNG